MKSEVKSLFERKVQGERCMGDLRDRVVPLEVYILYKGAVLQVFVFPQASRLCLPHSSNLPQDA